MATTAKPRGMDAEPVMRFPDRSAWEAWLGKHHPSSAGVWLQISKKGAAQASLTYAEALEEALIHGWIDGQKKSHDGESWLQRFTPRGPRSIWSRVNVRNVERLIEEGRMKPAGLDAVAAARKNGNWEAAYDSQKTAGVPDDLQAALDGNPGAAHFFATLDSANRYAVTWRVQTARKPETRARRIREFVEMLARGETFH